MKLKLTILGLLILFCYEVTDGQTLMPFQNRKGMYGYTDSRGKKVIPARYEYAEAFVDSFAIVASKGRFQILKADGKLLTDSVFDLVWPIQQGFILVSKGGKYAYIDRSGSIVRNMWFDRALLPFDNYAEAWQGQNAFLLFRDGNIFPYGLNRLQRINEPIIQLVQEMPRFPGGNKMRQEVILKMLKSRYSEVGSGMVSVKAVVSRDGELIEIEIVHSLGEGLAEKMLWVLKNMPPWVPAKQNGEPVRTSVVFSLSFSNT
jgi:hypothetical protein